MGEVHAVAGFASSRPGSLDGPTKVMLIERAMQQAVLDATAEGHSTSTPEGNQAIKDRMMQYRQEVLDQLAAVQQRVAEEQ